MIFRNNPLASPRSEEARCKTTGLWLMGTERLLHKVTWLESEFGLKGVLHSRNTIIIKVLMDV